MCWYAQWLTKPLNQWWCSICAGDSRQAKKCTYSRSLSCLCYPSPLMRQRPPALPAEPFQRWGALVASAAAQVSLIRRLFSHTSDATQPSQTMGSRRNAMIPHQTCYHGWKALHLFLKKLLSDCGSSIEGILPGKRRLGQYLNIEVRPWLALEYLCSSRCKWSESYSEPFDANEHMLMVSYRTSRMVANHQVEYRLQTQCRRLRSASRCIVVPNPTLLVWHACQCRRVVDEQ